MLSDPSIFDFLVDCAARNRAAALVTVIGVSGASVRNPGAHMAVEAGGTYAGSLSGGCIEAAVVAEALAAIEEQKCRRVSFGAGSPFIDIRLPCGGSVDLLITPIGASDWPVRLMRRLNERQSVQLRLPVQSIEAGLGRGGPKFGARFEGEVFVITHLPRIKINIIGHGGTVMALAEIARGIPADIHVLSPDLSIIDAAHDLGISAFPLRTPADGAALKLDRWTATIFYFHDHEWEPPLMAKALSGDGFFVGAMGSRKTQAARRELLSDQGLSSEALDRLCAPVGLFHSSRDPATLALSTLAQIVQTYQMQCVE